MVRLSDAMLAYEHVNIDNRWTPMVILYPYLKAPLNSPAIKRPGTPG